MSRPYIRERHALARGLEPLNAAERRWVSSLNDVLLRAPKRLALVTVGDAGLTVVDADFIRENDADIHDGALVRNGHDLAYIDGGPQVWGTTG